LDAASSGDTEVWVRASCIFRITFFSPYRWYFRLVELNLLQVLPHTVHMKEWGGSYSRELKLLWDAMKPAQKQNEALTEQAVGVW